MVKLKYLIISFCVFSFFACREQQRQIYIEPLKRLDVEKFMENKYKWKALGIKNYSFKYRFRDDVFLRYGWDKYKMCVGNVVVRNGLGTVTFDSYSKDFFSPDKNNPDDKCFYITSIDEAFDNVLEYCFKYQKMEQEGKVGKLYAVNEERYDNDYYFLNRLFLKAFWVRATRPLTISFDIEDFKLLD